MNPQTREEIEAKIEELEAAQAAATSWGAAVGARHEWLQDLYGQLRRMENPRLTAAERADGMPFEVPFNEREAALQKEVREREICPCCRQPTQPGGVR